MTCYFINPNLKKLRRAAFNLLIRFFNSIRASLYRCIFSDNAPQAHGARINLPTQFIGRGSIVLNKCQLGVWPSPFYLNSSGYLEARSESAEIYIGEDTVINNNFVIIADKSRITIGMRCLIGPNLFITDSDFHSIDVCDRISNAYGTAAVLIDDDVFIGSNVTVLKGSKIGRGSVIASGSIVTGDVEMHSVYGGVPAKKMKSTR